MLSVVTVGDEKAGPGQLVVTGEAGIVQEIGKK